MTSTSLLWTTFQAAPNAGPWSPLQVECQTAGEDEPEIEGLLQHNFLIERCEGHLAFVAFKLVNERAKTSIDDSEVQFVQIWKPVYYRNETGDKRESEIRKTAGNSKKNAKIWKKYSLSLFGPFAWVFEFQLFARESSCDP